MMSKLFLNNLTFYSLTALLILIIISSVITFFKLNSIYFLLSLFCTYLLLGILITRFSLKKLGINKNIINETELVECLKIEDSGNIIYDLDIQISIKKQSILKEILSFYNHKYQPRLDKIIKLLK